MFEDFKLTFEYYYSLKIGLYIHRKSTDIREKERISLGEVFV